VGEQAAQTLLDLLGVRLGRPRRCVEEVTLLSEKVLKLKAYSEINVGLAAIDEFIGRLRRRNGTAASVADAAKHRCKEVR
jgi:hypothetical protein